MCGAVLAHMNQTTGAAGGDGGISGAADGGGSEQSMAGALKARAVRVASGCEQSGIQEVHIAVEPFWTLHPAIRKRLLYEEVKKTFSGAERHHPSTGLRSF